MTQNASSEKNKAYFALLSVLTVAVCLYPDVVLAAPTPTNWYSGLCTFATKVTGPFVAIVGTIAIVAAGLTIAALEVKGWLHHLMYVILGIGVAAAASSLVQMVTNTPLSCGT